MKIFAHRGLWKFQHEQNSLEAITAAFEAGYSVEIDLWKRDNSGKVWIGHDLNDSMLDLEQVLGEWIKFENIDLALNIKCDGLIDSVRTHMQRYPNVKDSKYFAFDMSMPERVIYERESFPIAYRVSEYEVSELSQSRSLYWLDSFSTDWFLDLPKSTLTELLKRSIVVSPELHGRNIDNVYKAITTMKTYGICLDRIELLYE
jgi:glycerophosphoryl diester phosphodiesterase